MDSQPHLPTPRQLLTSLFNSLTNTPPPPQNPVDEPYSTPSNPLRLIPPSHRALLTTLHVLFPPGMLLQALDLLDRGLVTRLILASPPSLEAQPQAKEKVRPPQAHIHLHAHPEKEKDEKSGGNEEENVVYAVKSSQQPSRFKDYSASKGQVYTVRLGAWNCSCAAFAFSCFPSSSSPTFAISHKHERDYEDVWEFGGMSFDGRQGDGNVPVCKHLLACVLGERWRGVLGGYVGERVIGRGEIGGFGGE